MFKHPDYCFKFLLDSCGMCNFLPASKKTLPSVWKFFVFHKKFVHATLRRAKQRSNGSFLSATFTGSRFEISSSNFRSPDGDKAGAQKTS